MTRMYKTAKEYKQELNDLEKEMTLLNNTLIERATKLSQQFPDVIILNDMKAIDYIDIFSYLNNHYLIGMIETLEKELQAKESFKQTEIKFEN